MKSQFKKIIIGILILIITISVYGKISEQFHEGIRKVISLNGTWQIEEGTMDKVPAKFGHTVVVPGLVDLAEPAFAESGPKVSDRSAFHQKDPRRDAFWYRRSFKISGPVNAVARLKIGKAMYGTRIFLNGKMIGDHLPCFTPGWFDVREELKIGENELIIRVGADRDAVSGHVESGMDGEKSRYIPGIYDNVELILTGSPHIVNVQAVPDIDKQMVTVHSWISCIPSPEAADLHITVREVKSQKVVGRGDCKIPAGATNTKQEGVVTIPISGCRLWSPEDPFLYELEVQSAADNFTTRFGMRSFRLDAATGRAILNGNPYFMRGSNVTFLRFLEDSSRGNKPWDEKWVRQLHEKFRDMHWNCLRYCIGFAPEEWYRIADEVGIMIQDEYPVWYGITDSIKHVPHSLTAEILVPEFKEWMEERWNHPCVVIWDACNETYSPETGKAIRQVRGLDFSSRPWDNGWGEPVDKNDPDECHPYHFIFGPNQPFRMGDLASDSGTKAGLLIAQPFEKEKLLRKNPLIINEYGGIWLNRDGSPTTLSQPVYDYLMDPAATVAQRRLLYARDMAAITEFFRAHRQAAAVMHFCGLGYSRPDGQTSDDWINVDKLIWDPDFYTYVRDAFAPVGLMLDVWANEYPAGKSQEFPVIIINDLENTWTGIVRFNISKGATTIIEQTLPAIVPGQGTSKITFNAEIPKEAADYQITATLLNAPSGTVSSLRDFSVLTPQQYESRRNLALNRPVKASSSASGSPEQAVDGDHRSGWSPEKGFPQWLAVDLGKIETISRLELTVNWGFSMKSCLLQVSEDGENWNNVTTTDHGIGAFEIIRFPDTRSRWVRLFFDGKEMNTDYSITELAIYR